MKLLSVIVPFYNEEVFLEESVNRLVNELESSSINYEIFLKKRIFSNKKSYK